MASLKETKGRIASVSSTLKITSAMKMVASAKLHKAQNLIANMAPYESHLHDMLSDLVEAAALKGLPGLSDSSDPFTEAPASLPEASASATYSETASSNVIAGTASGDPSNIIAGTASGSPSNVIAGTVPETPSSVIAGTVPETPSSVIAGLTRNPQTIRRIAIVAISSNTSLCGAFNANAVKSATAVLNEYLAAGILPSDITVYSIGRKMAEGMKKIGRTSPADYASLSDSPTYEKASVLAQELLDKFLDGTYDKIELVYNHFKSTASQVVTRETYLPLSFAETKESRNPVRKSSVPLSTDSHDPQSPDTFTQPSSGKQPEAVFKGLKPMDPIIEPSSKELLAELLPKVVRLKMFTVLLDSSAAEHAARTVAMQTATDNGNDLLAELTLEYNKGRQQKITSEILDIVGGSLQ